MSPSATPSLVPSVVPSVIPTFNPTTAPTLVPTVAPSVVPTTRPTVTAVKDFELSVKVEQVPTLKAFIICTLRSSFHICLLSRLLFSQDVFFIDLDAYNAQKAASNLSIQHTVADAVLSLTPERVTDIVLEEEEEEGGRSSFRNGVISSALSDAPVRLKYKITVFDPVYTVDSLRSELMQAASEGRMDTNLRFYAAQFGATGLVNVTLAVPQVTNAAVQRDSSSQLTGAMIALLVIGVIMALGLVAAAMWFGRLQSAQPSPALPVGQRNV